MAQATLKGKHVVVTRSIRAGKEWGDYLAARGAIVHQFPTIKGSLVAPTKKLAQIFAHMGDFGWVIFTSPAGPYCMRDLLVKMRIKISPAAMPPIAVIGKKTADAVKNIGYRVAFMPSRANSATLARDLKIMKMPILLLRADIASDELPEALRARGAMVHCASVYKTHLVRTPAGKAFSKLLVDQKIDCVTFASPSAVKGFSMRVRGNAMKSAQQIPAIALGRGVALALQWAGFKEVRIAPRPNIAGVADAILRPRSYTI